MMGNEQNIPWFRELYDNLNTYRGPHAFWDVLLPWMPQATIAVLDMGRFKQPFDLKDNSEDWAFARWNLYALGRVNDLLLLAFQGQKDHQNLPAEQYTEFFAGLGFTPFTRQEYSPFHHEIVEVLQSDDHAEPIGILEQVWPGLMLGELMLSRSGVRVLGGADYVVKDIAERSMLYFAHRRLNRRTTDLSVGWGSNSQWRTSPRFDYDHGDSLIYNLGGKVDLTTDAQFEKEYDKLTVGERIEMCRNRCFVASRTSDYDLYPYDYRLVERVGCPTEIDPSRVSSVVRDLARSIRAENGFYRLPILADALEESGCQNEAILGHCRNTNKHGPKCWVVELLLGKE